MATVISALKNGLKSGVHPAMKNSIILRAKALLIGISLEKMIETSTDRHTDNIWKGIKTCYSNVIDDLLSVIDTLNTTLIDVEEGQKSDGKETDNQKLIEEVEGLKKEIETGKEERESLNSQFEKEKSELKEAVTRLEEENKKMC
eukprot:TRINITY_DN12962_c0_g1_i1.p2 TRINITY_DN12962_c0_g1~~TRINITY_DN12962_c0_g1_i1.p2  ORF type:complete len:145 (+),score=37.48 TRINITY_DN12962_c0_g1_i1:64-498(+)